MRHALSYAADGFAVFPVYEPLITNGNNASSINNCSCGKPECRGKHPRTANGVLDASTDAETIKRWWTQWPDASIGIATGKKSGIAVVDLDGPEGMASGRSLRLASPVTALTGSGKQLFYSDSSGSIKNSVKKLAPGVDTRGENGYVVVPPSLHPNGKRYGWETQPLKRSALVPLPPIFTHPIATRISGNTLSKPGGWIAEALGGMKIGNIDNTLISILGRMRHDGWTESDALATLAPHATKAGATPGHLEDKITHVWRTYAMGPQVEQTSKSEPIDAFLEDQKEVDWICKPIIAKKSIGFVAGLPKTSKTWMMVDLAVESARDCGNWLGIFSVAQSKVLFIDQERFRGETQRRFNAIIAGKGLSKDSLAGSLFLKCGTTIKLDLEASYQAFRAELLDLRPTLVIVDSFATFHNTPENDRMAIQNVLNKIKALRDEIGCAFWFVNHESKMVFQHVEDNKAPTAYDMLGSVGIVAAAESVLIVRKIEDGISMVHHVASTLAESSKSFTVAVADLPDGGIAVRGTL